MDTNQRNETYRAVAAGSVDPRSCEFTEDECSFTITHIPSKSIITVRSNNNTYAIETKTDDSDQSRNFSLAASWVEVPRKIKKWAEAASRKHDTPDLWNFSRKVNTLARYSYDDITNEPFSLNEQVKISSQLAKIIEYLKKIYVFMMDEQMALIEARLKDAEVASRRIGRKDWMLLFSGTVFSLIITELLTPSVAHDIFAIAFHNLGPMIFGSGPGTIPGIS
jgi:hypothetical protein